jgi:hypothetical protein
MQPAPDDLVAALTEAFTNAGLTWGRSRNANGFPEVRVRTAAGAEITVKVLKFSYFVTRAGSHVAFQRLSAADVLAMVRGGDPK